MSRQTKSFLISRFREMGIRPATRHGQNFLIDLNLHRLIVDSAELDKRDVVRHPLVQRIISAYEEHRGKTKPE